MTNREYAKAKDLVTFKTGKLDSNAAEDRGKYPFFTCAQTTYSINTYAFDTECVLLAGNNAAGVFPLKYYSGKFNAYQRTYVIEPINRSRLDIKYFYFYLRPLLKAFEQQATGVTTKFLTLKILNNLDVALPSIGIQKKIAAILSTYDDLIENNKRRIALLEKMAEEIYREWFVRMRFPGHEKVKFEKRVPEGWQQKPSIEIFDILSGGTPKTDVPVFWDGDIPFFTPKDAPENFYVLKTEKTITSKGLNACNSRLYKKNTIFITARGTVGKLTLAHRDMAMNQSCYALVPKNGDKVFFYFLALKNTISYVKGVSKSGVFDNIIVDTFKIIPILVPKENLIIDFNNKIEPFMKAIGAFLEANALLADTRDRLLSRLISGKLSVENLNIQFPPSMIELTSFDEHAKPKRVLLDVLKDIKIDAPEDFSENLDAYLNGEKHI